ncbi:tetratricopeptide repeat protein [Chthonobacter rhizosphaerae]|uniref:tetratricopeptide repeat protein n=1 Tax=Chthonobacter rhizosphaerae TaxID=2735553 RepID=UPI0015EE8C9A|nr:tetratricopeptide repeat protein [Chthonobacter rhizosphaerae]
MTPTNSAPSQRRRRVRIGAVATAVVALMLATGAANVEDVPLAPTAETLSGNYLAARFAGQQQDLDSSARFFAEALANDPEDPFLLERTFALSLASGDIDTAMELGRRLEQVDRGNRLAGLALGVEAMHEKQWSVAIQTLKRANVGPLAGLTVEILSAWSEAAAKNPDKALARLDKLSGEEWYSFFKAYHGGLIADMAGRKDEAIKRLAKAYEIDPGAVRVTEAFVRALARAGKAEEAKAVLAEALGRAPNHPLLLATGAELSAKATPKALISTPLAGAAEILAGLGAAIARDDTGELASVYLQLALFLDPTADLARISLAEIFERSKQFERAIAVLSEISDKSPLKRNAEIQVGFDYNALDKVDEARAHLAKLVEQDPSDLEAVTALGNVLRVRKMFAEAAETYSKGIGTLPAPQPQHWSLFYYRGIAYERTDKWPQAEADFKKALDLSPDQPLVLNYLGYSWVDRGMNYDEALRMIEKAVELEPTDGYIVDSLGWVYFKLGRFDEAVVQLERAVDLKPEDPVINDHLGDAYWQVGRKLEARYQWSHARDRKPEPADLAKILKKLEQGMPPPDHPAAADAGPAAKTPTAGPATAGAAPPVKN